MEKKTRVRVIGVGGAGVNAVDRLTIEGFDQVSILAVNTDAQALSSSVVVEKLQIGESLTHGLGAGGDPEIGKAAALEDIELLRNAVEGYDMIFLAAGLGGGTGTGASPVIARVARETGALVLGFVTMPFNHEGDQRNKVAQEGLNELQQAADGVVCIPNDKLLALVDDETSVLDAFRPTDDFLSASVCRIWQMLTRTGLINIDFADLCAVLRRRNGETLIGFGEGKGEEKVDQALEAALKSPLLSESDLLTRATSMLVAVTHGTDFPMRQLQYLLENLRKRMGSHVACKQGIIVDENYNDRVAILIIASTGTPSERRMTEPAKAARPAPAAAATSPAPVAAPATPAGALTAPTSPSKSRAVAPPKIVETVPPAPEKSAPQPEKEAEPVVAKSKSGVIPPAENGTRQQTLGLEDMEGGIFAKAEHTVVDGQDLDRPTFIRRGVVLRIG
jgi:cell division protein FtsZ